MSAYGKGCRLPGSPNPSTWIPQRQEYLVSRLIEEQGLAELIAELPANAYASSTEVPLSSGTDAFVDSLLNRYSIKAPGTRHTGLTKLIGAAVWQCGSRLLLKLAEAQWKEAHESGVRMQASISEHLVQAKEMMKAWKAAIPNHLTPREREAFNTLRTDRQREVFLIIWNFSKARTEIPVSTKLIAGRVGLAWETVRDLRNKWEEWGWIQKVAEAIVPHRAAVYVWQLRSQAE